MRMHKAQDHSSQPRIETAHAGSVIELRSHSAISLGGILIISLLVLVGLIGLPRDGLGG